ncbi:MAG TPA: YetF domain-containing protein [Anditalea sp.]|nr:YetF domain-containing protein [Anditalea sp.]
MDYSEVELWDWHRILIGDAPAIYLVEVFVRTIIIYVALLVTINLMGKRMGGQLTLTEMAVMVTLGALVAVPMQIYDRGLLMGLTALVVAIIFQRGFNWFGIKYTKFEKLSQGEVSLLIKDGEFEEDQMKKARISQTQLISILRNEQVTHISQVRRLYLEASGLFSLYKNDDVVMEESHFILPEKDKIDYDQKFKKS